MNTLQSHRTIDRRALLPRLVIFAMAALLSGCLTSLQPLYTAKDVEFDPALVGAWGAEKDSEESWVFEKGDEGSYQLTIREEDGQSSKLRAHLVRLGERRFLDLAADPEDLEALKVGGWTRLSLIGTHIILKVESIEPVLRMSLLDHDAFKERVAKNSKLLAHTALGPDQDRLIVTASTKDLQRFVTKSWSDAALWGDPTVMRRRPGRTAAGPSP